MRALEREYPVRRDSTRFYETFDADELIQVNVKGRVITWSRAHVRVNKWLEVSSEHGQLRVRTREYAYHANLRLNGEWQDLFRYDNCHGGLGTLHRHEFDSDGEQVQVSETAPDEMPPLAIVIREAEYVASQLRMLRRG